MTMESDKNKRKDAGSGLNKAISDTYPQCRYEEKGTNNPMDNGSAVGIQNSDRWRKLTLDELLGRKALPNLYFVAKKGDIILNPALEHSPFFYYVEILEGKEKLESELSRRYVTEIEKKLKSDLSRRYVIEIDTGLNEALKPIIQKIKEEVGTESGVYALSKAMQAFNSAVPRNKQMINESKAMCARAAGRVVPLSEFADKRLGLCLERNLLFYEALEQLSIGKNLRIVEGNVVHPQDRGGPDFIYSDFPYHAWVESKLDAVWYVADVSQRRFPHTKAIAYGRTFSLDGSPWGVKNTQWDLHGDTYRSCKSALYAMFRPKGY